MPRQGVYRDLLAARRLFRLCALPLGNKASLDELLNRYRQTIAQTGKTMHYVGVATACEHCAMKGGASCCFPGVENKYDKVLLLINFLLGSPPPETAGRGRGPGEGVYAIRNGIYRITRKHSEGNFSVPHGDPIYIMGKTQGEIGHIKAFIKARLRGF